jgi:SAM-dependent methyltransferase
MFKTITKWKREYELRKTYGVPSRAPFFRLAEKYLLAHQKEIVLDIGAGDGAFATQLEFQKKFPRHTLLDGNMKSVLKLKTLGFNAGEYRAPTQLPFGDASVGGVHLSHIVEHLAPEDLYLFIKEINRVLKTGGILVISTPLFWNRFYDDMSHIKPYNPEVFLNYLVSGKENATQDIVTTHYFVKELQYRYRVTGEMEWGSKYFFIDFFMRTFRLFVSLFGFRRYVKNGYTLVLEKGK